MALDLGTLVAYVEVDDTRGRRDLARWESEVRRAAGIEVPDIQPGVDTARAMRALDRLEGEVRGLPDGQFEVDADTSRAERALDDLDDAAGDAGAAAGESAGTKLGAGLLGAVAAIPVAGAVVGVGAAIGSALLSGFEREVSLDELAARTGLDEDEAARIGRAAGEAYGNNWGASVEENYAVAQRALQSGLIDPDASRRDTQRIIEQLTAVGQVMEEDVGAVARATGVILRNDLAGSADEAFDALVAGTQAGANEAGDLLETFTEYPALFRRLGLDASTSLALLSQGLRAGARDSDFVADALKEFQVRATDASTASARGFELVGLSAEDMTAKIARGGEDAREGLQQVLDGLRAIEDPVARNEAAIALFGTKAEDLGDALFALDASAEAVQDTLGDTAGAAEAAATRIGDNTASKVSTGFRNIELAAQSVLDVVGLIAADPLEEWASGIGQNRERVVRFLLDIIDGALQMGVTFVEAQAAAVEGFGQLVASAEPALDALAAATDAAADLAYAAGRRGLSQDLREAADGMRGAADQAAGMDEATAGAADTLRHNLIDQGLRPAQAALDEFGFTAEAEARFADAGARFSAGLDDLGTSASGASLSLQETSGSLDTTTAAGRLLANQVKAAVGEMEAQATAAAEAGHSVDDLTETYDANRGALMSTLTSLGLTEAAADDLINTYESVPGDVSTRFRAEGAGAAEAAARRVARAARDASGTYTVYFRQVVQGDLPARPGSIAARAEGGPIEQGSTYLVGERGPELVLAADDGYVVNARDTARLLEQASVSTGPRRRGAPADGMGMGIDYDQLGRSVAAALAVTPIRATVDGDDVAAATGSRLADTLLAGRGR